MENVDSFILIWYSKNRKEKIRFRDKKGSSRVEGNMREIKKDPLHAAGVLQLAGKEG